MSTNNRPINFSDYAVKMTSLIGARIVHQTEKGILVSFSHNSIDIQHWFPKLLTRISENQVDAVPTFIYEKAIAEASKRSSINKERTNRQPVQDQSKFKKENYSSIQDEISKQEERKMDSETDGFWKID